MIETDIYTGLADKLLALTLSPAMPIAWPNVDFTPPSAGYLRVQHFPVEVRQQELGDAGRNRFTGLFQVSVFKPEGAGIVAAMDAAASVAEHFKRGTAITSGSLVIRANQPPVVGQAIKDDPFVQVPVTIRYQVDASNP